MTDGTGKTSYAYDAVDQLLARPPSGNFIYLYDAAGNLLSRTYPNGQITGYSYDAAGEMMAATSSRGVTRYSYDPDGTSPLRCIRTASSTAAATTRPIGSSRLQGPYARTARSSTPAPTS